MSTKLPLVENTSHTRGPRTGLAAYARAARRYGLDTATLVGRGGVVLHKTAGAGDDEEEVPAESVQNDTQYVVPVTIGTPGVQLLLDFDTGSSDLWVWSSELKANTSTLTGHTIYQPSQSSTAKKVQGGTWSIAYGDGSAASGDIYLDAVKIGDVTIPSQGVELASQLSDSFLADGGSDGLLGLAWPSINTANPQQKTPMENLIEGKIIDQGVFSVLLTKGGNGFYSFGTIPYDDTDVYEQDMHWTPVDNSQGFWQVPSAAALIDSQPVPNVSASNTAILDTGTTLALVSDDVVAALYEAIPGSKLDRSQGGWVYPKDAKTPKVEIKVGDAAYEVLQEDLALGEPDASGFVFGGIQSRGSNAFDILGDVFLKSVFVVFDQAGSRVGLGQRGTSEP